MLILLAIKSVKRCECCKGCGSNVLQVCGLPSGLPCSQLDSYLSDLVVCFSARRFDVVRDSWHVPSCVHAADTVDGFCVLAVFDNEEAAVTALTCHSSTKYRLQPYTVWAYCIGIFDTIFCTILQNASNFLSYFISVRLRWNDNVSLHMWCFLCIRMRCH